jgi:hypothetical protein
MQDAQSNGAGRVNDDVSRPEILDELPRRQDVSEPARRWTFASPAPVYDADERQVGTLSLGSPGDYLVVQRAGTQPDLYIPLSAVNRSDESGVYLSLTASDLADPRWRQRPGQLPTRATPET